jgi:pilus assembly protein CpaE
MANSIRTLVALDTGVRQDMIARSLPEGHDIDVVGVIEGIDAAARALGDTVCDVLVVACDGYSDRALFLVESAVKQDPGRPVIVATHNAPEQFLLRALEVGADDMVNLPALDDELRFAILKALARHHNGARRGGANLGRMIVVLGPKGGTGKTLTSTNLAIALQQAGKRVALVDLDLQFGDVALSMGLSPERTIRDLIHSGGSIDAGKVDAYLTLHQSGVKVLVAPSSPDQAVDVTIQALRDIYTVLRDEFDAVVVDTPPGFTPQVIMSIDVSTDLVMVGMLDALSLKNTKLGLETLELMGYDSGAITLVLNRAQTHVGISPQAVAAVLGRTPEVLVPSDREIPRAINEGVPVMLALHKSEAAESFRSLASQFVDEEPAEVDGTSPVLAGAVGSSGFRLFGRRG